MADPRERWFIDDLEVTDRLVHDLETFDGLYGSPPLEGSNVAVPQRDGQIWVPKRLGAGQFTLRLWMAGDTRPEVDENWERLLRHAVKRHRLVRFERHLTDGGVRECYGEVTGRISPTPIGQLGVRAQIDVLVPSGVWQDTTDTNTGLIYLSPGTTAAVNRMVDLPGFTGSSAPLTALRATITGMATNVQLTCPDTGGWFRYDSSLDVGATLTVNAATDSVTGPNLDRWRYTGPYMFEVIPPDNATTAPRIQVTATLADHNATLRIVGRRAYQV
ncbi:hypothetical protein ABN028_20020 [Actinopolymorpha sp. B17G11]|uniref:hypothetical protein n=1 Tax=Actinopolymorpha sp. B17G11 TaxID=3160861 RepID=UPI0032E4E003